MKKFIVLATILSIFGFTVSCEQQKGEEKDTKNQPVKLMTLDPGHFHAALVQKTMYPQVDSTIYVFAPNGPEVKDFLSKIEQYNTRDENPTKWEVKTYLGEDYLTKMLSDKPGNVMVVAGKNSKKIDYILDAVNAGLNVYADKPLVIDPEGFEKLKEAFKIAKENDVLIYDIMTERYESTTMMQKQLSLLPALFGELVEGTLEDPAISKESVHHFFKYVSGNPLVRPPWFFDVSEEGEGIVDVTTHLVDLVQWEAFPNEVMDTTQIEMITARRWPTKVSQQEFEKVTGLPTFPEYLEKDVVNDTLHVYCNGEMIYKIKDKHAKVSVIWNFMAPEGTGDTHYSIMRGTKSDLIIRQGLEENYSPVLYIETKEIDGFEEQLNEALNSDINDLFPGTTLTEVKKGKWKVNIPDAFKVGHEAHFAQVTENYLKYLESGEMPPWEVPNMITKYYTTIEAYKMAKAN
ncbi:putative oxidoreductase C-terminal domain-containing protein [Maribacter sp. 4G9]|uniref:putative oxidoreductase C-terminal domain-containing protein n=1 Tax=Maribacter sp. 4G9 TaxID=1889777 RepID=UPI000C160420|nr:putative oxidoreductase C-terminal domain-containing protein [Maribacter sp. 4G9]PIB28533.1 oxidoreductase [Maribacter sp. 4G9]